MAQTSSFVPPSRNKNVLLQQQLLLLLHADKCREVEIEYAALGKPYEPCQLPHCSQMKGVLKHMTGCDDEDDCTFAYCKTSWRIVNHWKNCKNDVCPVCRAFTHLRPCLEDIERVQPTSVRTEDIKKSCNLLVHSSACHRSHGCNTPHGSCPKMKRVIKHFIECKKRPRGECSVCGSFIGLNVAHAKICTLNKNCPVSLCKTIRPKLRARGDL